MEERRRRRKSVEKLENLFSFELWVNSVHGISVKCVIPAVGYRLLDFPSLIIYPTRQRNINQIRSRIIDEGLKTDEKNLTFAEENLREIKNEDGSYNFNNGKSSLFSMNFSELSSLLSSVPVYVMLLDVFESKSKLLGSCSISLKNAIDELRRSSALNGSHAASSYKKAIRLNVFNLMGTVIGQVSLTYALYSYGNSLNNHVQAAGLGGMQMYFEEKLDKDRRQNLEREEISGNRGLPSEQLAVKIRSKEMGMGTGSYDTQNKMLKKQHDDFTDKEVTKKEQHAEVGLGMNTHKDSPVSSNLRSGSGLEPERAIHDIRNESTKLGLEKVRDSGIQHHGARSGIQYNAESGCCCPPPLYFVSAGQKNNQYKIDSPTKVSERPHENPTRNMTENISPPLNNEYSDIYQTEVINRNEDVYHESVKPIDTRESNAKSLFTQESQGFLEKSDVIPASVQLKTDSLESISNVLSSLNGLPILQGILKEIVSFSQKGNNLQKHSTNVDSDNNNRKEAVSSNLQQRKAFDDNSKTSKKSPASTANMKERFDRKKERRNPDSNQKTKFVKRKAPKKLKFKTTRTQQLRVALNSGNRKLEEKIPSVSKDVQVNENTKILNQRFMRNFSEEFSIPDDDDEGGASDHADEEQVRVNSTRYGDRRESRLSKNQSDYINDPHPSDGMKSKSPVSLEIRLPSTAGSDELRLAAGFSYQDNINLVSSSSGQSLPPLQRKWGPNEDLSKIQSIDTEQPLQRKWGANQDLSKIESLDREPDNVLSAAESSSRMSELEKLAIESNENTDASCLTPVGSETGKSPAKGRKSGLSYGYSTDNFDNFSESEDSSAVSSHAKSFHEKSYLSDSLDSVRISKNRSKLSLKGGLLNDGSLLGEEQSDRESLHTIKSMSPKISQSERSSSDTLRSRILDDERSLADREFSRLDKSDQRLGHSDESRSDSQRYKSLRNTDTDIGKIGRHNDSGSSMEKRSSKASDNISSYLTDQDYSEGSNQHDSLRTSSLRFNTRVLTRGQPGNEIQRKSPRSHSTHDVVSLHEKKVSDLTKPVASIHSPTTSRSQRTKLQFSRLSDDDVTRSINLSNLSLNTGSEYGSIDMDDIDRELADTPVSRTGGGDTSRAS